ncbi:VOC family protein [Candidatus Chlorohelix sp.]|uniref:VOC family protein n=1 Tax=Candidatus Chlorohelix sp. TaxID=3139201 RepID=UPI00304C4EF6
MSLKIANIVLDCEDPVKLADFWSVMTGWEKRGPFGQYIQLVNPNEAEAGILFQKVPEKKTVKNRMHLDFGAGDLAGMNAEVVRLIALGAKKIIERAELGIVWTVLHDPEGNEFCVAAH